MNADHSKHTKSGISANSWSYFNLLTFNFKWELIFTTLHKCK
ncbi:hypothetical protein HMPREF3220_04770 [Citrobacter koseri]|nr:hypothetical protein HMPREF3220_04770 [Citrobacter koseri]KWZ97866.1 hypothetical protein HMPREF3207_04363 [Citrobacter koseri]